MNADPIQRWDAALAELTSATEAFAVDGRRGDTPAARRLSRSLDALYDADAALLRAIGTAAYREAGRDEKATAALSRVQAARVAVYRGTYAGDDGR